MKIKIVVIIFLTIFLSLLFAFLIYKNNSDDKDFKEKITLEKKNSYKSNFIKNVSYSSKDAKGNVYNIKSKIGEIDINNNDVIFLTDVRSVINLVNSNNIKITSDFGKYNTINYDTIFSKNIIIDYLDNKITGEYLDFSLSRNTMIISTNVVYTTPDNILKADVIEVKIDTKDIKIFMHENKKKVNVRSKNYYGSN